MLEIRDLVKVYPGPVAALQGVDLDVPTGMFGLLGPNGAGQVDVHADPRRAARADVGRACTLDGAGRPRRPERLWARLGYLPQEFGFYPHLTGEQMLVHLLRAQGRASRPAA